MSVKSSATLFTTTGPNPIDLIHVNSTTLPDPVGDQLLLRGLVSFLNPADFATILGTYGTIPKPTTLYSKDPAAIVGNDGLFEVVAVGKDAASKFKRAIGSCPTLRRLELGEVMLS